MRKYYFLFLILLSGCSHFPTYQCGQSDWSEIGKVDGLALRSENTLKQHQEACGKNKVNAERYLEGYEQAKLTHCNSDSAFAMGRDGMAAPSWCKENQTVSSAFQSGIHYRNLNAEISRRQTHYDELVAQEAKERESRSNTSKTISAIFGESPKESTFEYEKINDLKNQAAILENAFPNSKRINAVKVRPASGALVGTLLGFGSGHAIQGRYWAKGAFFTTTEIGVLFIPVAPLAIVAGFFGLKYFEIKDLAQNYRDLDAAYPGIQ